MSEAVIPVHLSGSLLHDAAQEASRTGVSLEDWLRSLATDRVRDAYIVDKYLSRSPQAEDGAELLSILDLAPQSTPDPNDEL